MKTSESVKEILPALLSVTDSMQAEKDGKNPHFRSDYMTLDGILNTVKPILKNVGIVILQSIDDDSGLIRCTTRLIHTSGEYVECDSIVHADKMTPQGYGSAITYARIYSITTALGIAEADDDGNAAEVASAQKKSVSKPKPTAINTKKVEPPKDALLNEDQVNKIIKVFDDIDVEIWDLEKIVGSHEEWTESTRVKLLASYNNIQNGIKSVEDFKAGK